VAQSEGVTSGVKCGGGLSRMSVCRVRGDESLIGRAF